MPPATGRSFFPPPQRTTIAAVELVANPFGTLTTCAIGPIGTSIGTTVDGGVTGPAPLAPGVVGAGGGRWGGSTGEVAAVENGDRNGDQQCDGRGEDAQVNPLRAVP